MFFPPARSLRTVFTRILLFCLFSGNGILAADEPQWIWAGAEAANQAPAGRAFFRTTIDLPEVKSAVVEIACDNLYALFINNERVGAGLEWEQLDSYEISPTLKVGKNCVAVLAENSSPGPAGLVVRVRWTTIDGKTREIVSTKRWTVSTREAPGWREAAFDDSQWSPANELGALGATRPWGQLKLRDRGSVRPEFTRLERPAGPFQLLADDRVVFLGDTLVERATRDDFWETLFTSRFPDRNITFRNLGWSGDTVWGDARAGFGSAEDGYQQLKSQVFSVRPTVIFICYGSVSSFEGPDGLSRFQQGLERLLDDLAVTHAELILVSPLRHEHLPQPLPDPAAHNRDLKVYTTAIEDIARRRGVRFVDLYHGFISPSQTPQAQAWTDNGLHLTPRGYLRLGRFLETQLGWEGRPVELALSADGKIARQSGLQITAVRADRGRLRFRLLPDRLLVPPVGDQPGLLCRITDLSPGEWTLSAGEEQLGEGVVVTATAEDWSRGVEIAAGPALAGFSTLREKVVAKNQLHFHRWRPQNETYLFGFRKHEQGQNAKEIPQFDPLVEALEREIADLRRPAEIELSLKLRK